MSFILYKFAVINMKIKTLAALLLTAMLTLSCSQRSDDGRLRAMYYWSTVLDIDSLKAAFISGHGVRKMYVRYFDVVLNDAGEPVPNATLRFKSAVPEGIEIVPTVYIVNGCMAADTTLLARRLFDRVMQMNETNGICGVKEIQIDCDWTRRTEKRYFAFLRTLCSLARAEGIDVSATIRLHQLSMEAPPVSRGVLMMYNTGDFTDLKCEKPILDMRDAAPYLRNLGGYDLPLASAYPIFGWRILFRGGRYVGIMHRDDDLSVLTGDSIVTRTPAIDDILEAVNAVGRRRGDANSEIILFDLSGQNITRYKPDDYEKIFNGTDNMP